MEPVERAKATARDEPRVFPRYYPAMWVSTLHVRSLLEAIQRRGCDVGRFREQTALPREAFDGAYDSIELAEFDELCTLAVRYVGDPAFGLHWGATPMLQQLDLGRRAIYAPSLREACRAMDKFQEHLAARPELTFEERGSEAAFTVHPLAVTPIGRRVRSEFALAGVMQLLRYFGVEENVSHIEFSHPPPAYADEYFRILRRPVVFGRSMTGFFLENGALGMENHMPNESLYRALESVTESLLPAPSVPAASAARVRALVQARLPRRPRLGELAQELRVGERTLRRCLAREGVNFQDLVRRVQIEAATRLLAEPGASVKEVATQVGFLSATAFQRAFKRETGRTPVSHRRERAERPSLNSERSPLVRAADRQR